MLRVENLSKHYGTIKSVDGLNFELAENSVIGLLGENGAGKTTTMNMLTGCLSSTAGRILFKGVDIADTQLEYKRRIGYLPEIPPLYLDMTVAEQLSFVCEVKGISGTARKTEISRVAELTNISHMRNRLTVNLSKGYKQRVGLAQALLGSPEMLVLDEPMAGLDPRQITEMRELITSLQMTVLISSHILSEISAMCSRLLILKQGELLAAAGTAEFLASAGDGVLHLRVRAGTGVAAVLAGLPEVTDWQETASPESASTEYVIVSDGNKDIREELFFALAGAGIPVLYLELKRPTLEDIFIRLTS